MISVASYANRINDKYNDARAQYSDIWAQIDKLTEQMQQLHRERYKFTDGGFQEKERELSSKISALKDQLRNVSDGFTDSAEAIKAECKDRFRSRYGIDPGKVDNNAVILIQSGALSPAELLALSDKYANNATMRRLIGAELLKSGDEEAQSVGQVIIDDSKQQPHMDILNNLITIGHMALRVDEGDGSTLEENRICSDGVAQEVYPDVFKRAHDTGLYIDTD